VSGVSPGGDTSMTRRPPWIASAATGPLVGAAFLCATHPAGAAPPRAKPQPNPSPAIAAASNVGPRSIAVTVIELAGTRAYVQPGGAAGIRRGAVVTVAGKEYPVIDSSDSFAVIEIGAEPPREQEKGWARISAQAPEEQKVVELPKPRPLTTWQAAWAPEQVPADSQEPRFVPLGDVERNRRFDVRFTLAAGGLIPLGGQVGTPVGQAELNMRLHAEPLAAPLGFDLDASLQGWAAGDLATRVGASTRPFLFVRELLATFAAGNFHTGIGRMRYASRTLGTLDGVRVEDGIGQGFSVGAFGGLLPNPLSGAPSLDAQRFGVDAHYSRPDFDLRPEAALVVHGSTFNGSLDERRLSGLFSVYPGPSRFGGYFEVSNFAAGNPWGAATVALTAAGVDQSIRFGSFELGARFDVRQPERSRWLATFLPASWFCTTVPAPGSNPTAPEPCNGRVDTRAFGEIDARVAVGNVSLVVGGLTATDITQTTEPDMVGGFATARVVRIDKAVRLEASGNYSRSTYVNMSGGTAGPGVTLFDDALDVSAYYRITMLKYRSDDASLLQHGVGGTIVILPSSAVLFTLQAEAIAGDDANALSIFGTATWRPRL
jgi:hypothetical protein